MPLRHGDSQPRRERLDVRITADQKRRLERAAALRGQTLSALVVQGVLREADDTIREHEILTLSEQDSRAFVDALLNPQPLSPRLIEVIERYNAEFVPRSR